jgi:murein DD-endopeptidase MepM/ murein hydrolase activator NlpD
MDLNPNHIRYRMFVIEIEEAGDGLYDATMRHVDGPDYGVVATGVTLVEVMARAQIAADLILRLTPGLSERKCAAPVLGGAGGGATNGESQTGEEGEHTKGQNGGKAALLRQAICLLEEAQNLVFEAMGEEAGASAESFVLHWPGESRRVTQPFGARPEVYRQWGLPGHEGIDIGVAANTPVLACACGTVYRVHHDDGTHNYGTHVRIRHELADGTAFKTIYAHLNHSLVKIGNVVCEGMPIGLAGSTGNSTGPHLHLTLKKEGATAAGETEYPNDIIDPTPYLERYGA